MKTEIAFRYNFKRTGGSTLYFTLHCTQHFSGSEENAIKKNDRCRNKYAIKELGKLRIKRESTV